MQEPKTTSMNLENYDEQKIVPIDNNNPLSDTMITTETNSLLTMSNNQTIDFGENDPPTTINDETNDSISSS